MHNDQSQLQSVRPFIYQNYQSYRILQPRVLFIHGLPQKYSNPQVITSLTNLSNYNFIQQIMAGYKNQQYSTLALDGYFIQKRFLKVSFASTKFCPAYLKGQQCHMLECNYAHYYIAELAHLKDFAKQINHRALAFNKIWENYQQALILLFKNQQQSLIFPSGSIKLNQILFMKSEQFQQWEKRIQDSIDVLEKQLHKLKTNKSLKSLKKVQSPEEEGDLLFKDDWLNLDDSISDFLEQEAEESIKSLKRSKTEIQKFLDGAQSTLMDMIFKSGLQQVVLEVKNA